MSIEVAEPARNQSPKSYLYTTLIKTHLGEVASIVVCALISNGRLTAKELSVRLKVPLKLVKQTLVSLIQVTCVIYWKEDANNQVYYHFNETGVLALMHSGDIVSCIRTRYGEEAAEFVQHIIEFGNLKVEDYLFNFTGEESRLRREELITRLVADEWIIRVLGVDFNPLDDLWHRFYEECLKNIPRLATTSETKRVAEAKDKAKTKLTSTFDARYDPKFIYETVGGVRRLKLDLVIRFNLNRFEKYMRTRALVNLSRSRIGVLSSFVYEAALNQIEKASPDLRHYVLGISGVINDPEEERVFVNSIENKLIDDKKIVFSVRDIAKSLPREVDLRNSILSFNFLKPDINLRKRVGEFSPEQAFKRSKLQPDNDMSTLPSLEASDFHDTNNKANNNGLHETDNTAPHSISLINHHLQLLASSSSVAFLIEVTPGTYTVPFTELSKQLKRYSYDTLVKATLGEDAFRLLRCLKFLKLADEKTLSNSVLLKEKSVRTELSKLVKLSIIEIQEVPRSSDRAASKTFYLFRHKEFNAYKFLSNSLIFSMAEILQNILNFKSDHKILLEKCEREDVKGNEEELLLESELNILKELKSREIHNFANFNRVKSLYEIFALL